VVTTLCFRQLRFATSWRLRAREKDDRDNPPIHFAGELKDWMPFKQAVRILARRHDYSWVFDTGAALCDFYVSQHRDKAWVREDDLAMDCGINPKTDGNHVPTDVFAYHPEAMGRWFDKDVTEPNRAKTDVMLSLNKKRAASPGWCA